MFAKLQPLHLSFVDFYGFVIVVCQYIEREILLWIGRLFHVLAMWRSILDLATVSFWSRHCMWRDLVMSRATKFGVPRRTTSWKFSSAGAIIKILVLKWLK